ncbi:unnamed protein product [Rhizophagus irregularis]|nr:unnamed protein product [Rhizophagus irregularis]
METVTLNRLIQQDSKFAKPFEDKCVENKRLIKTLKQNIYDQDFNECTKSLKDLKDNTKQVINIMEQQRVVSNDLIDLSKRLFNKLEIKNALSEYRDWISFFNKRLRGQVGDFNVWSKAQSAIYNKVENSIANYSTSERDYVLQLETVLTNVHMTLEEYEILILMKFKSNCEFHRDRSKTRTEAKEKLNSFPNNMEGFKNALEKLFVALDLFESGNN